MGSCPSNLTKGCVCVSPSPVMSSNTLNQRAPCPSPASSSPLSVLPELSEETSSKSLTQSSPVVPSIKGSDDQLSESRNSSVELSHHKPFSTELKHDQGYEGDSETCHTPGVGSPAVVAEAHESVTSIVKTPGNKIAVSGDEAPANQGNDIREGSAMSVTERDTPEPSPLRDASLLPRAESVLSKQVHPSSADGNNKGANDSSSDKVSSEVTVPVDEDIRPSTAGDTDKTTTDSSADNVTSEVTVQVDEDNKQATAPSTSSNDSLLGSTEPTSAVNYVCDAEASVDSAADVRNVAGQDSDTSGDSTGSVGPVKSIGIDLAGKTSSTMATQTEVTAEEEEVLLPPITIKVGNESITPVGPRKLSLTNSKSSVGSRRTSFTSSETSSVSKVGSVGNISRLSTQEVYVNTTQGSSLSDFNVEVRIKLKLTVPSASKSITSSSSNEPCKPKKGPKPSTSSTKTSPKTSVTKTNKTAISDTLTSKNVKPAEVMEKAASLTGVAKKPVKANNATKPVEVLKKANSFPGAVKKSVKNFPAKEVGKPTEPLKKTEKPPVAAKKPVKANNVTKPVEVLKKADSFPGDVKKTVKSIPAKEVGKPMKDLKKAESFPGAAKKSTEATTKKTIVKSKVESKISKGTKKLPKKTLDKTNTKGSTIALATGSTPSVVTVAEQPSKVDVTAERLAEDHQNQDDADIASYVGNIINAQASALAAEKASVYGHASSSVTSKQSPTSNQDSDSEALDDMIMGILNSEVELLKAEKAASSKSLIPKPPNSPKPLSRRSSSHASHIAGSHEQLSGQTSSGSVGSPKSLSQRSRGREGSSASKSNSKSSLSSIPIRVPRPPSSQKTQANTASQASVDTASPLPRSPKRSSPILPPINRPASGRKSTTSASSARPVSRCSLPGVSSIPVLPPVQRQGNSSVHKVSVSPSESNPASARSSVHAGSPLSPRPPTSPKPSQCTLNRALSASRVRTASEGSLLPGSPMGSLSCKASNSSPNSRPGSRPCSSRKTG
ncbi:cell wall protein DAN4 isoform X2 [Nematostella vectensis]|uniref:cell wall protein DAN4 isoform X2 n=1 Tax=Nematostella vectensis TaxID=45351 RepID=UPI0013906BA3|nr:cell wall protein DAN4 isoform X2 [Nematostella vectensis]